MKYGTRIEFDSRRLIRGRPADAVKFLDAIYVYDSKCRYKGVCDSFRTIKSFELHHLNVHARNWLMRYVLHRNLPFISNSTLAIINDIKAQEPVKVHDFVSK